MEAVISFFLVLVILALVVFGLMVVYKYRRQIAKWVDYPYYANEDRDQFLRRKIEDAEKELVWRSGRDKRQTETEGD